MGIVVLKKIKNPEKDFFLLGYGFCQIELKMK